MIEGIVLSIPEKLTVKIKKTGARVKISAIKEKRAETTKNFKIRDMRYLLR